MRKKSVTRALTIAPAMAVHLFAESEKTEPHPGFVTPFKPSSNSLHLGTLLMPRNLLLEGRFRKPAVKAAPDRNVAHCLRCFLTGCARLVVFGVLVHRPDIILPLARQNVCCSKHCGHHGVVLIVILMHAIAANQVKGGTVFVEGLPNRVDVHLVSVVINRICLGLPDDAAIDHIRSGSEIYLLDFPLRQFDQLTVTRGPQPVPLEAEIFQTIDRKSTRLNSSHANISYAVFC